MFPVLGTRATDFSGSSTKPRIFLPHGAGAARVHTRFLYRSVSVCERPLAPAPFVFHTGGMNFHAVSSISEGTASVSRFMMRGMMMDMALSMMQGQPRL